MSPQMSEADRRHWQTTAQSYIFFIFSRLVYGPDHWHIMTHNDSKDEKSYHRPFPLPICIMRIFLPSPQRRSHIWKFFRVSITLPPSISLYLISSFLPPSFHSFICLPSFAFLEGLTPWSHRYRPAIAKVRYRKSPLSQRSRVRVRVRVRVG